MPDDQGDAKLDPAGAGLDGMMRGAPALWKIWTVPRNAAPLDNYSTQERDTATWFGLAVVVLLTFLLRGLQPGATWWAAPATAGVIAASLNALSMWLRRLFDQRVVISGYATIALIMAVTIVVRGVFDGSGGWYPQFKSTIVGWANAIVGPEFIGPNVIAPIVLSVIPSWAIWLLKARLIDKHAIGLNGAAYAAVVTMVGAIGVVIVCIVSDEVYLRIIHLAG